MPEITWRCLTDRFLFKSTTPDCFPSKIKPTLVGFPVLHITSVCQLLLIFVNQGKPPFVVLNIFGKKMEGGEGLTNFIKGGGWEVTIL